MSAPWKDPNDYHAGEPVTVDMVVKTINAAHEIGAIQDIVVMFNYFDPETGYKSVFRNASLMQPVELVGLIETTKQMMLHLWMHGERNP